ncbi:MAG: CPBP family intramembrane metalloprotease [Deltaproteobacteria bacterium]|nr:MAG: CPBP family intramembrane metalloprotease [Deltaproteobacteria bacterium]
MRAPVRFSVATMTGRIAVGYALLASLATALALALHDGPPWQYATPWIVLDPTIGLAASAGLGLLLSGLVVFSTRVSVSRFPWAQHLHLELRPIAHGLTAWQIVLIAGCSSLGEELLFRGLLQPWIGVLPQAVLFGIAHQLPGPSRWLWVCWAMLVGLACGAIFAATGSLIGPLIAHAVINAVNLAYLRDHDPRARRDDGHAGRA